MSDYINGLTMATTHSATATPDGAATYNIATAVTFCIGGKAYSKATVSGGTTPVTDGNGNAIADVGEDKGCLLVWTLDASGTVDLWQSDVVDTDESGNFLTIPDFPTIDTDMYCPIAYTVLTNTNSTAFDVGTTNWNATGATATTVSVLTMPRRPQES